MNKVSCLVKTSVQKYVFCMMFASVDYGNVMIQE
jgi:hypothetical protein